MRSFCHVKVGPAYCVLQLLEKRTSLLSLLVPNDSVDVTYKEIGKICSSALKKVSADMTLLKVKFEAGPAQH